jgi:hypothetical protein
MPLLTPRATSAFTGVIRGTRRRALLPTSIAGRCERTRCRHSTSIQATGFAVIIQCYDNASGRNARIGRSECSPSLGFAPQSRQSDIFSPDHTVNGLNLETSRDDVAAKRYSSFILKLMRSISRQAQRIRVPEGQLHKYLHGTIVVSIIHFHRDQGSCCMVAKMIRSSETLAR